MTTKNQKIKDSKTQIVDSEELGNMKNQLARAMADYANLVKRTDEERGTMYKLTSISYVLKLLPILDNLREAQKHLSDTGIAIIVGQLEAILKEDGFSEIKPQAGEMFNETLHEAIDTLETEVEKDNNIISEVCLTGWKMGDEVVRFAKVKVFNKKI
ncbi:MAG: Protein GrpE [Candidatus Woesebacteria bacterium GW2011_GWA1_33_30]|uniref:Protein GrpE n=1 Tax=Candidatus Woesebacteria bacterium GW2011_GWA2_33_28 TaxID=1618561 RepID=A0A0G0CWB0_9BACT|nr:MAG: Protein GrpE [Candidatus Woesebacteria bacterium GW2011_GWA2_33_28]KKP48514.1 MAG: Protein GrpE [Candidatus Woesebacteria bacterium GW2011_GWA1_33_30]KKP49653.1 MAG: Protein GrpE [Microgenomates group bacterium GW2011_GWC1_33_32]KKP52270.1 MAG: Protein GrpE [Candidatus Woesebacteria bacterium GW2011_GWB1_33_38]